MAHEAQWDLLEACAGLPFPLLLIWMQGRGPRPPETLGEAEGLQSARRWPRGGLQGARPVEATRTSPCNGGRLRVLGPPSFRGHAFLCEGKAPARSDPEGGRAEAGLGGCAGTRPGLPRGLAGRTSSDEPPDARLSGTLGAAGLTCLPQAAVPTLPGPALLPSYSGCEWLQLTALRCPCRGDSKQGAVSVSPSK